MKDARVKKGLLPDSSCLSRYLLYILLNRFKQTADDLRFFPASGVQNEGPAFHFKESIIPALPGALRLNSVHDPRQKNLRSLLKSSGTTAFLIVKDDNIICEEYFDGHARDSLFSVFSITKSIASALTGFALADGHIGSIDDAVTDYLPELASAGFGSLTIKDLLLMNSGVTCREGRLPWHDEMRTFFSPDCRSLALHTAIGDPVGAFFHYNDYHPLLLGMILERATKMPVSSYLQTQLWQPLGAEFPAFMKLDSAKHHFAKLESGLCCTAVDLAKFGRLFLRNGDWNGKELLSRQWVEESTGRHDAVASHKAFAYYNRHPWGQWFASGKAYYKYFWWGYKIDEATSDYFAMGILGQFLYLSPTHNTLVVRLGKQWGVRGWWPTILKEIVDLVQ
jgi:CubicO group peptidase (beta-lactamase class C family)